MAGFERWMLMGADSGAGVTLALWWHCHCTAIGAETGLGLAYLRQSEFIILNNDAVSGFFAQKFRSVQRLRRFTAPLVRDDRSDSACLARHGLACPGATARVAPHGTACVDLRRARHPCLRSAGCAPPPAP